MFKLLIAAVLFALATLLASKAFAYDDGAPGIEWQPLPILATETGSIHDEARARGRAPTMRAVPASQPASLTAARLINAGPPRSQTKQVGVNPPRAKPTQVTLPIWTVVSLAIILVLLLVGMYGLYQENKDKPV